MKTELIECKYCGRQYYNGHSDEFCTSECKEDFEDEEQEKQQDREEKINSLEKFS